MIAIAAAIVELKAHCEHTWEIIRALERYANVVEEAHSPKAAPGALPTTSVTVTPTIDFAAVTKAIAPKAVITASRKARTAGHRKANGRPAKASVTPAHPGKAASASSPGAAILAVLGSATEPLAPKDLIRLSKLPRWKGMRAILALAQAGTIVRIGHHRGATYQFAVTPRPGAVAGTQAAPPVGPPSANGRQASPGGFEVAWSGTKERAGEAPSILPPRERKA